MDFISHLWLPIVVASVATFVLSAIIWMALPHHKGDFAGVPDEDGVMALLRKGNVGAGAYTIPHMSPETRKDKAKADAVMKKFAEGPGGILYVFPKGPMNMGSMLGKQFVFFLVANTFVAAAAAHSIILNVPATFHHVFVVVGLVSFMMYFLGMVPESIWFGRPWRNLMSQLVDAILYSAATAAVFGWLWK